MKIQLLSITPDAEKTIEEAGRTCYLSKGSDPSIIQKWVSSKHESVLEHASASFRITGISRACSHQLVRHRLASYSQQSQRYTNGEDFAFVIPESIAKNDYAMEEYVRLMNEIRHVYKCFTKQHGIPHEDARFILPNACHTEIVMTANMREWRHILQLRLDKHAQWEIRDLCRGIGKILLNICPNVFYDIMKEHFSNVEEAN